MSVWVIILLAIVALPVVLPVVAFLLHIGFLAAIIVGATVLKFFLDLWDGKLFRKPDGEKPDSGDNGGTDRS